MGQVRVGTASWTDRTLIDSGWYPPEADTPEQRLRYYARQFPLVEVDATYYALPAEQTATSWAARTPAGFTFNVKAFSLFTQHPTRVAALPTDLRPAAEQTGKDRIYLKDIDSAVADQAWQRFLAALEPLQPGGQARRDPAPVPALVPDLPGEQGVHRGLCTAGRAAPGLHRVPQPDLDDPGEPGRDAGLPGSHRLPYVCVDMPQGYRDSIPPVVAATDPDLAVVRMHGHSDKWTSKDIHERFGYRYSERELGEWAPKVRALAEDAATTHVLFNNCYRDYAQTNARQLADLLKV